MTANNSPPATPADIRLIGEKFNQVLNRQDYLENRIPQSETRIQRHFNATVETIRHDLMGAKADVCEAAKQKIVRIQEFVRLLGD